jgi:transcription elongation factor GreA|tara:strand:- start:3245 stop:3715 length:471 start_codon:yes stop_codon:yes gene_type:complete
MEKMPISPKGFELLQQELKRLKNEERPKIIKMIEFARSLGDLSENAEYETAKDRQSFNDKRVNELETKLSSCVVIDPNSIKNKSKLVFGLSFEIEDLDSGEKKTYQLLGPEESNPESGSISIEAPLARGVLGREQGDEFIVQTPSGPKEYILNRIF